MSLAALLSASRVPLFVVGSEKNAGKTVALNRLRAEARRVGLTGFGICSVGWDGEARDHLTGADKPRVPVYEGDIILTGGSLLAESDARFEIVYAASLAGRAGRLVIGRCLRPGEVELVGPPSASVLSDLIARMQAEGARRVLIDGAVDRKTPISAALASEVGLAFRPLPRESVADFVERVSGAVHLYRLPTTDLRRPERLGGEQAAFGRADGWEVVNAQDVEQGLDVAASDRVWIGGPLTPALLDALVAGGVKRLIVDDPSRIFLYPRRVERLAKKGVGVELLQAPRVIFVAVRTDGGQGRSLPPKAALRALRKALPDLECFDPWLVGPAGGAA